MRLDIRSELTEEGLADLKDASDQVDAQRFEMAGGIEAELLVVVVEAARKDGGPRLRALGTLFLGSGLRRSASES